MPNILAHSHITTAVKGTESPDLILGSVLPDFQGMFMARKIHPAFVVIRHGGDLEAGINFHQLTDRAFDDQDENREVTGPMSEDLMGVGLHERAAKLTADFVGHIMLDAAIVDDESSMRDYNLLKHNVLGNKTLLARGPFGQSFSSYVIDYFYRKRYRDYRYPRMVAKMAQARLESRGSNPERNFLPEQIPVVAEVLAKHADRAGQLGTIAMAKTIEVLKLKGV